MEDQRQMNASASTSTTCITCLPREILAKILSGLPVKSAVRFRCSCRFFYSYIPEPRFAFRILFLLRSRTPHPLISLNSVSYSEESHGRVEADSAHVLNLGCLLWAHQACSSCAAGKMCLRGDALFDIKTGRRISLLPTDPSRNSIDNNNNNNNDCRSVLRRPSFLFCFEVLGFDSVSSERYKVFKSAVYSDCGRSFNRLWVLTVGVDKSWREIEIEIEIDSTLARYADVAVHIHGIIYFIPRFVLSSSSKIVAMDVSTERFIRLIPFPPCKYQPSQKRGWVPWMKLNGRLAFINIIFPRDQEDNKIEIWRLERSMEDWEKQTLLLPLEESEMIRQATFMGCTTNSIGEIVFLLQSDSTSRLILIYSFERGIWRRFEVPKVCNNNPFHLSDMMGVLHTED